jgi:hypothetical protein
MRDDYPVGSRVYSAADAAAFVARAGLVTVFGTDDLPLPSLWEEVTGSPQAAVFVTDENGHRHLSDELQRVWALFTGLAAGREACVGRHLRGRVVLLSPAVLADMYALTGRDADPGDFEAMPLPRAEYALASALLDEGPLTAAELRSVTRTGDTRGIKRSLDRLQRELIVTQAGERERRTGWAATVYDLTARRHAGWLGEPREPDDARARLASVVRTHAPGVTSADVARLFGWRRRELSGRAGPAGGLG